MKLLGAKVISVKNGTKTLKEAVDVALEAYSKDVENTYYLIGSAVGPAPYPEIVRFFQSVIGSEIKEQILEKEGRLPTHIIACAGGGSNAIGTFHSFVGNKNVNLVIAEAAGEGIYSDKTACSITRGENTILHGFKSYVLKDKDGNPAEAYSIASGLDYPGIGPEISYLHSIGRTKTIPITDNEAIEAFHFLSKLEGIIPAIESSHAIAVIPKIIDNLNKDDILVITLSGRGDKDCDRIMFK